MAIINEKQLAADAVDQAFAGLVKAAAEQFINCVIEAGGDPQKEADCRTRFQTGLTTFRAAHKTSGEIVSAVFPDAAE